jgi:Fe-S-cluster-containing dehydrogenase component
MKKWNLIVDVANCTNCNVCALAVQDEHVDNRFPGYAEAMPKHGHRWINIERRERGTPPVTDVAYLPVLCQHCDDAPCIKAAPDAIRKRADGIVIIDPEKAHGRREIITACPYGAVWWNEEKQLPQHWFFDAHLLDAGWKEPRCVTVCATNVFRAVCASDAEMQDLVRAEQLETLHPEINTRPRVYYKNLWRYNRDFIAGSVSGEVNGMIECLEGARVELRKDGQLIAEQHTDAFGDFKFDRLPADGSTYTVRISAAGFGPASRDLALHTSCILGEVRLQCAPG